LRLDSPSSHGLGSAPEYDPDDSCLRPVGGRLALLGFPAPIALLTADSDWYRDCLPRLRCVYRLSQPLDALFRPRPFRPCLMPVALLGFSLQRFLLRRARRASRRPCPSWLSNGQHPLPGPRPATPMYGPVPRATRLRGSVRRVPDGVRDGLQGFERRQKFVRPARNLSVTWLEPLLSWVFTLPGYSPHRSRHGHCHVSSHALQPRSASNPRSVLQSLNEPASWLVSRETTDPHRISVLILSSPGGGNRP
jgi:hypothetical protein